MKPRLGIVFVDQATRQAKIDIDELTSALHDYYQQGYDDGYTDANKGVVPSIPITWIDSYITDLSIGIREIKHVNAEGVIKVMLNEWIDEQNRK